MRQKTKGDMTCNLNCTAKEKIGMTIYFFFIFVIPIFFNFLLPSLLNSQSSYKFREWGKCVKKLKLTTKMPGGAKERPTYTK